MRRASLLFAIALPLFAQESGKVTDLQFKVLDLDFHQQDVAFNVQDLAVKETNTEVQIDLNADVLFDFDKADVLPKAEETLTKAADIIKTRGPKGSVRVEGYTDSKGDDNYNMKLSLRRAESIRDWLVKKGGLSGVKFETKGFGETQPVASNTNPDGSDSPEGRAKNRRVTIVFGR
jgi:outer membrane protein OmpA-like peptidoglycan-associated protein